MTTMKNFNKTPFEEKIFPNSIYLLTNRKMCGTLRENMKMGILHNEEYPKKE